MQRAVGVRKRKAASGCDLGSLRGQVPAPAPSPGRRGGLSILQHQSPFQPGIQRCSRAHRCASHHTARMAGTLALPASPDTVKRFMREEWGNPSKRSANLKLLRAVSVFAAGVIVARVWGEALFVQ